MTEHDVLIKMCGMRRTQDVTDAVHAGANALGYVFYRASPRFVEPEVASNLVKAAGSGVQHVGLFVNHEEQDVIDTARKTNIDVLQFHGNESAEYCEKMNKVLNKPYWKAIHISQCTRPDELVKLCKPYQNAHALLFDTASSEWGGTGQTFEWHTLLEFAKQSNAPHLVLSGGLNAQNVAAGIKLLNPWMVDVSSGIEACNDVGRPLKGIKSKQKMQQFVQAVKAATQYCDQTTKN